LNLPADEQQNIVSTIRQAVEDARDAGTGIQQGTPQQRRQKMQDVQKIISDAKDKVEGMLTAEQKTKYFPLFAKLLVKQAVDRANAIQAASAKLEIGDDEKAQVKSLIDGDLKTLDGFKTDADAVTDDQGASDLQQKITKVTQDTRRQLVDILGQDDVQQLMQNLRQAGGGGAGGATGGARTGRGGANGATPQAAPTTMPAAK
jgi:hypothetical protein